MFERISPNLDKSGRCERLKGAKQSFNFQRDCFVASLLAKTELLGYRSDIIKLLYMVRYDA
jgi:hypothetical protein